MVMVHTVELDMDDTVAVSDIDTFLTNVTRAIRSTYHTGVKASPSAAIFGWTCYSILPSLLTGTKLETTGSAKQISILNTFNENTIRLNRDYKIGDKALLRKDGIHRKSKSWYERDLWNTTSTSVRANRTIRVQHRFNLE